MPKKIGVGELESSPLWETLEAYARTHVQALIQRLLEEEITELLGRAKSERRGPEAEKVYRNGYGKPRRLTLSSGTIEVRRPRVRGMEERLESQILPLFKRRSEEVKALLPRLYLHGLALGDFELAMRGLLGEGAPLSPATILRLKEEWQTEYDGWRKRDLSSLELVYCWADGLYVKAGIEDGKAALLVVIGALSDGSKTVLAVESGQRESTESWRTVLRDLKSRGLRAPRLVVADGHLGIWSALTQIWPEAAEQRCWNHKLLNVLDQVPLRKQPAVKAILREIMYARTRAEAERLRKRFAAQYRKLFPKAVAALERDWERMVTYYSFPEAHWPHLRTTNIIESPFAAVRLRTDAGKRYKRVENATALIWKILLVAERQFRRLRSPHLLEDVAAGVKYVDGIEVSRSTERVAA
jgi:transposase-like protein